MNQDNNPQPQPEQLLKMLETQIAASRARRTVQESSRRNLGMLGLVAIVIGAAVALGMLMYMLEQMRPQRAGQAGATSERGNNP